MTDSHTTAPVRTWARWPFRVATTVAAAMLFLQAVFAGQFLAESLDIEPHFVNAILSTFAVLVVVVTAVLVKWPGRGSIWPFAASLVLLVLMVVQAEAGFFGNLALHVPLGVGVILLATALAVVSWLPAHRRPAKR